MCVGLCCVRVWRPQEKDCKMISHATYSVDSDIKATDHRKSQVNCIDLFDFHTQSKWWIQIILRFWYICVSMLVGHMFRCVGYDVTNSPHQLIYIYIYSQSIQVNGRSERVVWCAYVSVVFKSWLTFLQLYFTRTLCFWFFCMLVYCLASTMRHTRFRVYVQYVLLTIHFCRVKEIVDVIVGEYTDTATETDREKEKDIKSKLKAEQQQVIVEANVCVGQI